MHYLPKLTHFFRSSYMLKIFIGLLIAIGSYGILLNPALTPTVSAQGYGGNLPMKKSPEQLAKEAKLSQDIAQLATTETKFNDQLTQLVHKITTNFDKPNVLEDLAKELPSYQNQLQTLKTQDLTLGAQEIESFKQWSQYQKLHKLTELDSLRLRFVQDLLEDLRAQENPIANLTVYNTVTYEYEQLRKNQQAFSTTN